MALWVVGAVVVGLAMWGVIADDRSRSTGSTSASPTSGQGSALPDETKVVTASDKKSQITVPTSWTDVPGSFKNELASIQVGDVRAAQYVLVISAVSTDFESFPAFAEACLGDARVSLVGIEIGEARNLTIDGRTAVQYQVTGKASGFNLVYWFTMVEGKAGYYEVVGWTMPSKKAEVESNILKVIESFRELGAG